MSLAKRREMKGAGRGPVGKEAVVGVKDRESGQVSARHVRKTDIPNVAGFVAEKTKDGAKVYTDEAKVYSALDPWFDHESVNHSVSEYVRDQAHTQGMESFWSMMKRGYVGIYHKMSPKHLQRYVDEFSGRHNARNADTVEQMRACSPWHGRQGTDLQSAHRRQRAFVRGAVLNQDKHEVWRGTMTDKPYGQHLDPLWDRLAENNGRMKAILDFGVLASKTKNHASGIRKTLQCAT